MIPGYYSPTIELGILIAIVALGAFHVYKHFADKRKGAENYGDDEFKGV